MEEKKTLKRWFEEVSENGKRKALEVIDWGKDHKETMAIFGPVFIGSFIEIIKIVSKHHTVNEEKALKERYIYDRSLGHYYEMKRQPKRSEWLQIDQRKQNGETLGEILNDMKLLK